MRWLFQALCSLLLLAPGNLAHPQETRERDVLGLAPVEIELAANLKTSIDHYTRGNWMQAVQELRAFLRANPNDESRGDCHFLLGESLVQLKRYDEAAKAFHVLLELNPKSAQASRADFRLAEAAMLLGQEDDAIPLLQQFHARHPRHELNAFALPYLAHLVAARHPTQARALFSLALQQHPDGPLAGECRFQSAMLDYQAGEFPQARSALLRIVAENVGGEEIVWNAIYWLGMAELHLGNYQAAAGRLGELPKSKPDHALADASLYFSGEAYRKSAKPAKAAHAFQQLRNRWPDSPYFLRSITSELKCLRQTKDGDRALDLLRQLKQRNGESSGSDATRLVAEVLLSADRFLEAHGLLRPLAESPPSLDNRDARDRHYQHLYLYSLTLRGLGKLTRASEMLGRVRVELAPPDLGQRVMLARIEIFNESGDFGSAIRTGVDAEPQFPPGRLLDAVRAQLVKALIKADKLKQAKSKFRQMQQQETDRDELMRAARWLAEATFAANDLVNARRLFEMLERWRQSEDDYAQAVSGLAWVAVKEENHAAAVARFEQLLRLFPGHPSTLQVRLALSQSLSELGKSEQAVEALACFQQLKKHHPARAEGLYRLALLLEADPDERERATRIAETLVNDHPTYERHDAALYLLGILQQTQSSPAARQSFSRIVDEYYTSKYWPDALFRLAEQAAADEDPKTAKRYLTKLISSQRDRRVIPHALYLRGKLESAGKSWADARETLRELIRDYPESPLADVARYGIAESFFQEKNYEHARKLFDLLDREERNPTGASWQAMLRLRRAQLFVKQGQYLEAGKIAKHIASDFPNFSLQHEADFVLGRASAAQGEFTDARQRYARVVAADPDYRREITAMAQWMIGETHFHRKNFRQAIQAYKPVYTRSTFPQWQAASLLQVGKCYEKLDDAKRAKQAYSRVLDEFGASAHTAEATDRLRVLRNDKERGIEL